jgi:predicted metal-dependent phosphoesterase TrpH
MTTVPVHDARNGNSPLVPFGAADLQVHTSYGDGMASADLLFERIEAVAGLDVVAVTDHDDIGGALLAREVHARGCYSFEFVPGVELTTRAGHLLALWVDEPLRPLRPLGETIAAVHRAGGVAIIPHPFSYLTRSVGQRALEKLIAEGDAETMPDAIEVANLTLAGRVTGMKALRLNRERYHLAETGGSDAHFPEEVGTAVTLFPGRTAEDLRRAILERRSAGVAGTPVSLRSIGLRRLAAQQVRGLAVTPRKVLGPHVQRFTRTIRR